MTRAHVLARRADLEQPGLAGATISRKLAALASLFVHLLENNAVAGGNPVHGVTTKDRIQRRQNPGPRRPSGQGPA